VRLPAADACYVVCVSLCKPIYDKIQQRIAKRTYLLYWRSGLLQPADLMTHLTVQWLLRVRMRRLLPLETRTITTIKTTRTTRTTQTAACRTTLTRPLAVSRLVLLRVPPPRPLRLLQELCSLRLLRPPRQPATRRPITTVSHVLLAISLCTLSANSRLGICSDSPLVWTANATSPRV